MSERAKTSGARTRVGPNNGLLQSLLHDPNQTHQESLADVVLMVALTDSLISDEEFERVQKTMVTYSELEDISEDWILKRALDLRDDAPLFSGPRLQVVQAITDPKVRRLSLSVAAKIVGALRPLQEEEKALLFSLADAFKIPELERSALLASWNSGPAFKADHAAYSRCEFNSPDRMPRLSIFDALAQAPNEAEFRLLIHKLSAIRSLVTKSFEGGEIDAIGERLAIGPYEFRIDALIDFNFEHYLVRFLASGEALHPLEHALLTTFQYRLHELVHVLIAHSGDLSATDKVFLAGFEPQAIRTEALET